MSLLKVSTKVRYGLRALLEIAEHNGQPVSASLIAERQEISMKYLENLLAKLMKSGILISRKGARGGYFLADRPEKIDLKQVFSALDDDLEIIECLSKAKCSRQEKCRTKILWDEFNSLIEDFFSKKKLVDLMEGE